MKNILAYCLTFSVFTGICAPVFAVNYDLNSDTVVENGESMQGGAISINQSLTITNHGLITGAMNVCNNCDLYIENTGTFNASVILGTSSTLTQVIKNDNDITTLGNVGANYSVLITDTTSTLNWNDIVSNSGNATTYKLKDAQIQMNSIVSANNVDISDRVIVYTNIVPNSDVAIFRNISGTGVVRVVSTNLDALYLTDQYMSGSDLYVRAIRTTDYARVLNNNTGIFLNHLRTVAPDDKLLAQLDSATTFDEFNHIMSKSVRIHPIQMMQSVKTLYSHKMAETMYIAHDYGFGIMPVVVFSDEMSAMGVEPYLNVNLSEDLDMKIFGGVFGLKYSDDINSYGTMSYGVGADVKYSLSSNNFARLYGGLNLSSFDTGLVFDGNTSTENPTGWSGYLIGELGHRFDFGNEYYITPFVLLGGDWATILNSDETNYYVGTGGDVGFNFEFDGLRYDYAFRGVGRSDGAIGGELKCSIDDNVGMSYHIGLNAKFNF